MGKLGKSQPGKYPYEGSICHKSKCYHWSLGGSSLGTHRRETLRAETGQAKCGFCALQSVFLSWFWAIHAPQPQASIWNPWNSKSGEEGGFFSCAEKLIFMARGSCTGALSHKAQSHIPNEPPGAGSCCPSCRRLCSGKAHPPQLPWAHRSKSQSFVPTVQKFICRVDKWVENIGLWPTHFCNCSGNH